MEDIEIMLMQLISYSGEAKALCFEAIESYKAKNTEEGSQKFEEAYDSLIKAKKIHGELLCQFANGNLHGDNLLLIHAEDQMMSSETILDLAKQLAYCVEKIG